MPIKVPQHIIDNDVMLYGQCCIETDQLGNERRLDPLQLKITTGSNSNQLSRRGIVYEQKETPNIKGRLELRGQFDELTGEQFNRLLGVTVPYTHVHLITIWETLMAHGYMIVKPGTPSTIDDGLIAFKRYKPIMMSDFSKKMTDEQIEDFKKKFNEVMRQGIFQVPITPSPVCTCRDDDKYARPLCPVCDKEKFDRIQKEDIATITDPADFFKSIKGDI